MSIISMENISFSYRGTSKTVLENINLSFEKGAIYAIVGNSGEGKSTMLGLLAGLDVQTEGSIKFDGEDISQKGYSYHRKHNISLVFQNYNLIDYMTPMENVQLADRNTKKELLLKLGLSEEEIRRNVLKLSGGQQQRVAIARALASSAPVILADEPTGNLDGKTAKEIMEIFKKIAKEENRCVIIVTHSREIAKQADTIITLKNKRITLSEK